MKLSILILSFLLGQFSTHGSSDSLTIYLIPGIGADARLFNNLRLNSNCEIKHIEYFTPKKGTSMNEYAKALSTQVDTASNFVLIGASLGGMLAIEMNEFIKPSKTILISSAKNMHELPGGYRFQQRIPVYKLIGPRLAKAGSQFVQPIFEPDRKNEKETFKRMLKDKDPLFLDRAIEMTMNWDRKETEFENIYHIHGDKDHTIPIRNVNCDFSVENGSHLMTLTRGDEVSLIINNILSTY